MIGNAAANMISVGHGANVVDGGGGADTIVGSGTENTVFPWHHSWGDGRDGSEVLHGGSGNDRIVGGTTVFGDGGNDTLVAGWNRNVMTGGSGADHFVFSDVDDGYYSGSHAACQSGSVLDFNGDSGDSARHRPRLQLRTPPTTSSATSRAMKTCPSVPGASSTATSSCAPADRRSEYTSDWPDGVRVAITGTLAESDVLFV